MRECNRTYGRALENEGKECAYERARKRVRVRVRMRRMRERVKVTGRASDE